MPSQNRLLTGFVNRDDYVESLVATSRTELDAIAASSELTIGKVYRVGTPERWFRAVAADGYIPIPDGSTPPDVLDASDPYYGGFWNGTDNDSVAYQDALDDAAARGYGGVMLPPTCCFRDPLFVQEGVAVLGYGDPRQINTQIKVHADADFSSTGYILNFNTTDGLTPTVSPRLGEWIQCIAAGLWLNNSTPVSLADVRLMILGGTYFVDWIRAYKHAQILKKMAGQYIDNGKIGTIFAAASYDNSLYAIDIGDGGGDGLRIGPLNFPASSTPELAVKVDTGNCRISDAINGGIYFVDCSKAEVVSHHSEHGQIVAENTSLSVRGAFWKTPSTAAINDFPIKMLNTTGNSTSHHSLELDNVAFIYGNTAGSSEGKIAAEVAISHQVQVKCRNARRVINEYGAQRTILGIRFAKVTDENPLTEVNRWSHILSDEGVIVGNLPLFTAYGVLSETSDFSGITSSNQITSPSGDLGNTTYYYTSQLLLDSNLKIGRNQTSAERSQATGGANRRLGLTLSYGSCSPKAILRVYRGTSTGSYDSYVDLPVMKATFIVDQGTYCCGVPWKSRGAGAVDTLLDTTQGDRIITPGGTVLAYY